jgi:hypothetical protein
LTLAAEPDLMMSALDATPPASAARACQHGCAMSTARRLTVRDEDAGGDVHQQRASHSPGRTVGEVGLAGCGRALVSG